MQNSTQQVEEANQEQATLQEQCSDWLKHKSIVSTLRKDLEEEKKSHPDWNEYAELKVRVDRLRNKILESVAVLDIKTRIDKAKGRLDLLNDIIIQKIEDQQISFFEYEDKGKFKVSKAKKLKYERNSKNKK